MAWHVQATNTSEGLERETQSNYYEKRSGRDIVVLYIRFAWYNTLVEPLEKTK